MLRNRLMVGVRNRLIGTLTATEIGQDIWNFISQIFGDADFNYVSLLLPFSGRNGNTTFYDASPIPKTVTRNGNTVISSAQSKFGGTSGYFDGSGDYLSISDTSVANLGTSNFTIEAWVYTSNIIGGSNVNQDKGIFGSVALSPNIFFFLDTEANHVCFWDGTTEHGTSTGVAINTWTHVAVTRNFTDLCIFINGVLSYSGGCAVNFSGIGTSYVGSGAISNRFFNGYIDDFRITKGLARYTSSFSVPTSPFPTDWEDVPDPYYDNVVLHLPMDGPENGTTFVDRSLNPKTVTTVGNTALKAAQSKFGGTSCYFDGTGDYLSVPYSVDWVFGTNDFTIEAWVYVTANSALDALSNRDATITAAGTQGAGNTDYWWLSISGDNTTTGIGISFEAFISGSSYSVTSLTTVDKNVWNHVAVCRASGVTNLYLNGVQLVKSVDTLTTQSMTLMSNPLTVGGSRSTSYPRMLIGYIDSLRITMGFARYTSNFTVPTGPFAIGKPYVADPYASSVKLLLTGNGSHGTQVIEDASGNNNLITIGGQTIISRIRSKVGSGSIYFNGNSYLKIANSVNTQFGSSDFTIDFWLNFFSLPDTGIFTNILINRASSASDYQYSLYAYGGSISFQVSTTGSGATHTASSTFTQTADIWMHVALVRNGSNLDVYINGIKGSSDNLGSSSLFASTSDTYVGVSQALSGYMTGYIDNLRITKGVARYTSNFTPEYSYLT